MLSKVYYEKYALLYASVRVKTVEKRGAKGKQPRVRRSIFNEHALANEFSVSDFTLAGMGDELTKEPTILLTCAKRIVGTHKKKGS